ncbi:uncharacterized protein LOC125469249 [Pyrus x bretschneideri]|uniref:uncharacterized protein LOC125469249 n=1 Tax=Pyrus x bretschneideri TaxID=225117 RepID=UPI00202FD14F|nr:uncharacterized protein LOC125469249 [Pyrus x bretschneideri]
MANMSRSLFTNENEQMESPQKFSPLHFTLFKGEEDPDRHLMHYQNAMTIYYSNDAYWFHTLSPQSIQNFSELSLVFIKEYSFHCSIKKKSDHLFNMKNDLNESLCTYVKRVKVEKMKIVECNDNIAYSTFRKGLPADHSLFEELIMSKNLTLADFYVLAEKHSF